MTPLRAVLLLVVLVAVFSLGRWSAPGIPGGDTVRADDKKAADPAPGWVKGKGYGHIWGKDDEVGALNAVTPATIQAALKLAKDGKVFDMGVTYSRNSFRWPGHNPAEILTFRSPEGVNRQRDFAPAVDPKGNPDRIAWHSCAIFINDNVATQIDGLGHITAGPENRWYNGFKEADYGGNFGIRKCDSTTIPPIITRGVLLDVAGSRGVDALPAHYRITVDDLKAAAEKQKVELKPGDTILIRTGTLRYWGEDGADHDKLRAHDSAGIDLAAARWLVEEQGAILIGSDTSGLEWLPGPDQQSTFLPVHKYLLVDQGVHIGEFHYLEDLAKSKTSEFCYCCVTNKIKGTTAGFTLRPLALR
jgi:kynurenine formamidase